jgi:AbiV family abortive infection protein
MASQRLPDEREAVVGAVAAGATATGLLGDADLLAGAGRYGSALSLGVLAFEEAVKARSLGAIAASAAQGREPGFVEDTLRKIIYRGHQARHEAGLLQHVAAAFPMIYGKLILGIAATPGEIGMLREFAGLLNSANARKQAGFYTDFDPDSGSWSSPSAVSEAEFGKIRALVGQFVVETQRQTNDFISFQDAATRSSPGG